MNEPENINDKFVYGWIRQDIYPELQVQQFGHLMHLAPRSIAELNGAGIPHLITFGIAHEKALVKIIKNLEELKINYFKYIDPNYKDWGFEHLTSGVTGLVTEALNISDDRRNILKKYRMYDADDNTVFKIKKPKVIPVEQTVVTAASSV